MINYKKLGERVRKERKKHRITQEELAESAGISSQYLSEVENGKKPVSLTVLVEITKTLRYSLDELIFGDCFYGNAEMHVVSQILKECSDYERAVIIKIIKALRNILAESRDQR